jgi:Na+/glutamate symporter
MDYKKKLFVRIHFFSKKRELQTLSHYLKDTNSIKLPKFPSKLLLGILTSKSAAKNQKFELEDYLQAVVTNETLIVISSDLKKREMKL